MNQYLHSAQGELAPRVIGGASWTFGLFPRGKLTSESMSEYSTAYLYDGLGRRAKSVIDQGSSPVTNVYVFSGLTPIYETNGCHRYVYANGLRIAKVSGCSPQTKSYYHYDHLGNVRAITDGNGNLQAILAYKPFGLCVYGCASEPTYGYTGEYREAAPNLVYLHSRWYDPTIGRFLSADDRLGRLSMPQDQNRYAYVVNNPMKYTDPTGHDFLGDVWNAIVGFVMFPINTLDWLANRASWQEVVGFFAGVAAAVVVGFAIGLACATVVGCPIALGLLAGALMGAVVSSAAYVVVTAALGGTPTQEGLGYAFGWGMIGGGFGAGLGVNFGIRAKTTASVKPAAAEGETAPEVAEYYRYVGEKELAATRETNILRPGETPPDYFTTTRHSSASRAQAELSIPARPTHGFRFRFSDSPEIAGPSEVQPRFGQPGRGVELSVSAKARIKILDVFPLGP